MAQLRTAHLSPLDNKETDENSPFLQSNSLGNKGWSRSPLFFLLDISLVSALFYFAFKYRWQLHHLDCQGDTTGYAPAFFQQVLIFRKHPEFISNHTSLESLREAREHWKTLVPPGQGFIEIDEHTAEQYDFPRLIKIPEEAKMPGQGNGEYTLGTSVVHSLHCLWTMMAEYDLVAQGNEPYNIRHMDYCYDYIRQAVMCGADMALAGEDMPGGSSQFDVPHVCKNWQQVYDWLDLKPFNDQWQFGEEWSHWVPPN